MDPASIITAALVAGAAAAAKATTEHAVKDLYDGIKQFIADKYKDIRLGRIEKDPADATRRNALKQDVEDSGADKDADLLARVNALLDAIEQSKAASAAAHDVGVNIAQVKAGALRLHDVTATGNVNLDVKDSEFSGDIDIGGLHAGQGPSNSPN